MTPAEREELKLAAQRLRDSGCVRSIPFNAAATPEAILSLISKLESDELTLSNSTNLNVMQMERVDKLEELLRRYRYFGQSMCSNPDCDVLTCIEKKSMEREFTKLMLLAAPTEPTPEESE